MNYVKPRDVNSPKAWWYLFEVVLDGGPGECAYALGKWGDHRRIGFRWNGDEENKLGNPQSRGFPTWIILDPALYEAVIAMLSPENQSLAKIFLEIRK